MTQDDLKKVLRLHSLWLDNEQGGKLADLSDADLLGADLIDANLRGAILSGANLSGADLRRTNLSDANLGGANLRGANLIGADLSDADLKDANMIGADLSDANLRRAYLWSTRGNGFEVRSLQCGTYDIAYTEKELQIGCQRHFIDQWWRFSDDEIDAMDSGKSLTWWRVWKPLLQQIIAAAPATPTGKERRMNRETPEQLQARMNAAEHLAPGGRAIRHVKSGTEYIISGHALRIGDLCLLVHYRPLFGSVVTFSRPLTELRAKFVLSNGDQWPEPEYEGDE